MTTELIVELPNHTASLDLLGDLPVSLNYAIADIKEPSKRNGAFSKSIKLPGTPTNNKFFEHTYDVNVSTNKFNPNLKTPCYVLQDSIEVFRGYLRLREIEVELVNDIQKITYEATILGDNQDLFGVIGDSKLQDLDMSAYNHTYNRVNQVASWTAPTGSGYVYPLIDYGYNSFLTNSFNVEHFRPAFYVKTYIDKIFAAAGKTYTSTFLNSAFFKKWIVPHNGDKFTMSASNLANYEFYAGNSGAISSINKSLTNVGSTNDWYSGDTINSTSNSYLMKYNDDSTSPFVDTGNVYDTSTGIFTVAQSGNYVIQFKTDFEIKVATVPAGTATINLNPLNNKWPISYKVLRSTDGGATWSIVLNDTPNYQSSVLTTSYQTFAKTFTYSGSLNTGDQVKLLIHPLYSQSGYGLVFKDGGGTPITVGTASIEWRFKSSATVKESLAIGDYVSGQSLVIGDAIPKDIKQKDFLMSVFRAGRLYVSIDPNDKNNYIIQTRNEYYSLGSTIDWSDKLALDMPYVVSFPAEIDIKNFIFRYKSDSDYYNKKYEDTYQEPYGTYKKVVSNDFTLKDEVTELIFSPTPIVDNTNNSIICPKIFSYDGTTVKPQKHNIRLLMYNGVETMTAGSWNYVAPSSDILGAATLPMTTYPAAAMVDNALNPTVSIEFGVPNTVFYSPNTYTTNHIFNREYSQEIAELTDRDARIVAAYFYLRPPDIAQFDFRNSIYVRQTYFFANKISDYNKLKPGLTKVELLKITTQPTYTPVSNISIGVIETNNTAVGMTARYAGSDPTETNFGSANNVLLGDNNRSASIGSYVSGSRNSVGTNCGRVSVISTVSSNINDSCDSINIMGCSGINVGDGCSGIILMNCKGVNIADYTYDFTGLNLTNEDIPASDSGRIKNGLTQYFLDGTSN
jgi:hypothetical protein